MLHDNGVIHKDFKGQNVMITKETNAIIIIDFGISFLLNDILKLKTITSRWPSGLRSDPEFVMPTMK